MILENSNCIIEINIDETFTIDSTDNCYYDIIHNPCQYKHRDFAKTLAIYEPNWDVNPDSALYEIVTQLMDCYYCLPERPDLATLFCWQAISNF